MGSRLQAGGGGTERDRQIPLCGPQSGTAGQLGTVEGVQIFNGLCYAAISSAHFQPVVSHGLDELQLSDVYVLFHRRIRKQC